MAASHRLVWRVEKNGEGAFRSGLVDDAQKIFERERPKSIFYARSCPNPSFEPSMARLWTRPASADWFFGFSTLRQYEAYFNCAAYRGALGKAGGRLLQYRVPTNSVIVGEYQTVFVKHLAEVVGERVP